MAVLDQFVRHEFTEMKSEVDMVQQSFNQLKATFEEVQTKKIKEIIKELQLTDTKIGEMQLQMQDKIDLVQLDLKT